MSHRYFRAALCFMLFTACTKKDNVPGANDTQIVTFKANYYIGEPVIFTFKGIGDSLDYDWNFGDDIPPNSPEKNNHRFVKGGIYTVRATSGKTIIEKRIRIFPGTQSFQVQNVTSFDFTDMSLGLTTGSRTVGSVTLPLIAKNSVTDTIFVDKTQFGQGRDYLVMEGRINSFLESLAEIRYAPTHTHTIFIITDEAIVSGSRNGKIGGL